MLTSNQGLILPDGTDNANVPLTFTDFVTTAGSGMENRLVQRYLSIADRTARNGAPNEGELSYLLDLNRYEKFDGVAWVPAFTLLIDQQIFTANGSWIKPAGAVYVQIMCQAGGAAGGGPNATGASQVSAGAGGQGGAYVESILPASSLGASESVVVGAAGIGVVGSTGGNGGTSSFGAVCSAAGGTGGLIAGASGTPGGIGGGTSVQAMTGQIQIGGGGGGACARLGTTGALGGQGGDSFLGNGGAGGAAPSGNVGSAGSGYGGGGGGSAINASAAAIAGSNGAPGIVIVRTFG